MNKELPASAGLVLIENPRIFFDALGDLHDAAITEFEWLGGVVTLRVPDMHSAFLGWTGYPGPTPGCIAFCGLRSLVVEVAPPEEMTRVYSLDVRERADSSELDVELDFAPGGTARLRCLEIRGDFDSKAVMAAVPKVE
jgi:hypothetical protein